MKKHGTFSICQVEDDTYYLFYRDDFDDVEIWMDGDTEGLRMDRVGRCEADDVRPREPPPDRRR